MSARSWLLLPIVLAALAIGAAAIGWILLHIEGNW